MAKPKKKKHFSDIKWVDHLLGLLVVIIGVTIAFQLDNLRANQALKKTESIYLDGLLVDLDYDERMVDTLLQLGHKQMESVQALITMATVPKPNRDSLGYHLLNIQFSLPFTAQVVSYAGIKSDGMGTIADHELRRQIAELYEQYYRGASQYDAAIIHHLEQFVQPYTINNSSYSNQKNIQVDILNDPVFKNIIFPLSRLMQARLEFYVQMLDAIQNLKKEINSR